MFLCFQTFSRYTQIHEYLDCVLLAEPLVRWFEERSSAQLPGIGFVTNEKQYWERQIDGHPDAICGYDTPVLVGRRSRYGVDYYIEDKFKKRYTISVGGLLISHVQMQDEGVYACSNEHGHTKVYWMRVYGEYIILSHFC